MAEFIEKKETFQVLRRYYHHRTVIQEKALREALDMVPVANVKPVIHAHWQRLEGDSRFMCSVCKWKENVPTIMGKPTVWDYCPSCGSMMRKRNEH